jgi:hypothetical protein
VVVQKYRFCPGAASVEKYTCPSVQAVGRAAVVPAFAGAVLPAPLKSTAVAPPFVPNCAPEKLFVPVHVLVPATVAKPLVSAVGFFHVLVALQNHRSWFVVSTERAGGAQLPAGAPAPAVIVFAALPLICVQTPGVPVTVQKYRFCPAATSVAK